MTSVNIYIITYGPHRIDLEKQCIERTHHIAKKCKYDCHLYICDNNSPQEFKDWLKKYESTPDVSVYIHSENIGKARIVNMVHKTARKSDYIVSMDSDMIIQEDCLDFFEKLIEPVDNIVDINGRKFNVGAVSSDQLLHPCHQWQMIKIDVDYKGTKYKTASGGIAGGILAMTTKLWESIGGYVESKLIFGGNDGNLLAQVRSKGQAVLVSLASRAEHLGHHETPELKKYHEWKVAEARGKHTIDKFQPNRGYYDGNKS